MAATSRSGEQLTKRTRAHQLINTASEPGFTFLSSDCLKCRPLSAPYPLLCLWFGCTAHFNILDPIMETSTIFNSSSYVEGELGPDPYIVYVCSILNIVLNALLLAFGTLGNSLILRVYCSKKRKTSTHILIIGLALADLMVCTSLTGYIADATFILMEKPIPEKLSLYQNYINIWIGVSVGITGFIALDRYDCVCRTHRRVFNSRRAKIAILVSLIPSVAAEAPIIISCAIFDCEISEIPSWVIQAVGFATALVMIGVCYGKVFATIRRHVKVCIKTATNSTRRGLKTYGNDTKHRSVIGQLVVCKIIDSNSPQTCPLRPASPAPASPAPASPAPASPAPVLTSVHSADIQRLGSMVYNATAGTIANEQVDNNSLRFEQDNVGATRQMTERSGRFKRAVTRKPPCNNTVLQRKTTMMLFVTSVVFLLTWLPFWLTVAVTQLGHIEDQNVLYILRNLVLKTFVVNNAVNPLIYGLANRRFREDSVRELRKLGILCNF